MDKNDWRVAYRAMSEVYMMVNTYVENDIFEVTATLENYPPKIEIKLVQKVDRSNRQTRSDLVDASEVVTGMCQKAMDTYPWLRGNLQNRWKSYSNYSWNLTYELKPRNYSDIPGVRDK